MLLLLLLAVAARLPGSLAFVLHGGSLGSLASSRPQQALLAIALGGGAGEARATQQHHLEQEQQQARQAAAMAAAEALSAAGHHEAAVAGPQQQIQAQPQAQAQGQARARWPRLFGRDLRSPFISVEVRPATRLEELMAAIDLRAECFAGQQLSVEAKLRHTKHVLARRCVPGDWWGVQVVG